MGSLCQGRRNTAPYWADVHLVIDYGQDGHVRCAEFQRLRSSGILSTTSDPALPGLPELIVGSAYSCTPIPVAVFAGTRVRAVMTTKRSVRSSWLAFVAPDPSVPRRDGCCRRRGHERRSITQLRGWPRTEAPMDTTDRGGSQTLSSLVSEIIDLTRHADLNDETSRVYTTAEVMPHVMAGLKRLAKAVERVTASYGRRCLESPQVDAPTRDADPRTRGVWTRKPRPILIPKSVHIPRPTTAGHLTKPGLTGNSEIRSTRSSRSSSRSAAAPEPLPT